MLDYIQSPSTLVFHITNPVGNWIVQYGLQPLQSFLVRDAVARDLAAFDGDRAIV